MPASHMNFARALCMHFRLPMDQVLTGMVVSHIPSEVMVVRLELALSGHDLAGITRYMSAGQRREDNQAPLPPLDMVKDE